jgi:hypothetical protein
MGPRRPLVAAAFLAAILALSMSGCGGSGGATGRTSGGAAARPAFGHQMLAESDLTKILATIKQGLVRSFKLTYQVRGSRIPGKVTLEQMPPDQLVKWRATEAVFNGKEAYTCVTKKPLTCVDSGRFRASPLGDITDTFSADTYVATIESWLKLVSGGGLGYHVSLTARTFVGQPSECVSWSYQGSVVEYCVTSGGVLAYVGVSGSSPRSRYSFLLTGYSTKVSVSDFALPRVSSPEVP